MKCSDLIREYVLVSVPVLISDGLLAIGGNMVAIIIGGMGGVFMTANSAPHHDAALSSVLTQGVSHASCMITGHIMGEGDTASLMAGDILFLWVASVPLGYLAGLVFHWPPFWATRC